MDYRFGPEFTLVHIISNKVSCDAERVNSSFTSGNCVNVEERDGKRKGHSEKNRNAKGRAKSDTGATAEKWRQEGANRYCKQAKSDSGVSMKEKAPIETKASTMTTSNKIEQMNKEVVKSGHYQGESNFDIEFSPGKSHDADNHGHEHDHCAMTTIQTITITTTTLPTQRLYERRQGNSRFQGEGLYECRRALPGI